MFDDLLAANEAFQRSFRDAGLHGTAARRLAVLTCIDSRIDPLRILGLEPGDAKILRNAGARATPDVVRSLILATNLLDVERVCVIQHTDCAMARRDEPTLRATIEELTGTPADGIDFLTMADQLDALRHDVAVLRAAPLLAADVEVGGFVYDVHAGSLRQVDC